MKRIPWFSIACAVLVLRPAPGLAAPAGRPAAGPDVRSVVVPGEGEARAVPDEVTFTIGVVREGPEAKNAKLDLAAATRSVLAAIRQRGVAEADIQTAATSLAPNDRFEGGKRTIAGYRASASLTVKVRTLDAYDGVLAAAMQAGANEFHGATFGSSVLADLESQARSRAVLDARRRADALARAAGATVGRILSIAEGHVERPPLPMAVPQRSLGSLRGEPVPGGPSLAGGEITVRVAIQATWLLE